MGFLDRIFSGKDETPPAPMPVQVCFAEGVVLSLLPSGRIDAWDLDRKAHLWGRAGAGPMLAIQGQRVLDGQGRIWGLRDGQPLGECGLSGLPVVLGGRLGVLGWHRMWVEGQEQKAVEDLDPSPEAKTFYFRDSLLLIDPGARALRYLDPETGALESAAKGVPIDNGALLQEGVVLVRERTLERWDLALTRSEPLAPRHTQQTLSPGEDSSVGIGTQGLELWDARTQTLTPLPGPPPTRPGVLRFGDRVVCETWQGLSICRPDASPQHIELPLGRRKGRPLNARVTLCAAGPKAVLLATYPPQLIDLNTGRHTALLAPPSVQD